MWQWLNPLNIIKILSLIKYLYDSAMSAYKSYQESKAEKKAKLQDQSKAKEAVDKIQKPVDVSKPKEQRDKDEEAAFDDFYNKLK